jgi:hypothetical protein
VSALFALTATLNPPFPLSVTLTLVAAPRSRIAAATFRITFLDGDILSVLPTSVQSDGTQVHHTDSKGNEIDLNAGTGATLPAQGGATWKNTGTKGQDYQRTTWGRIQGSGIGFKTAMWVFEEDPGKGGRHGVPISQTTEELSLGLSVRPALCEYEVEVTIVDGDGERPGFFNSHKHSSGKQRVILA